MIMIQGKTCEDRIDVEIPMFGGESYLQYTISEDDSIRHSTDLVMELFADNKVTINSHELILQISG